jgi:hypothetical protein
MPSNGLYTLLQFIICCLRKSILLLKETNISPQSVKKPTVYKNDLNGNWTPNMNGIQLIPKTSSVKTLSSDTVETAYQ